MSNIESKGHEPPEPGHDPARETGTSPANLTALADRLERYIDEVRPSDRLYDKGLDLLHDLRQHAAGGWVPVSERLPENHNTGSTTKGSRFARVLGCNDAMPQLGSFEVYLRFPGDKWDTIKEYRWETPSGNAIEITHWHELPAPPHTD